MFGNIFRVFRMSWWIPICKVENIPLSETSWWWLLTGIEPFTTGVKMQETWWMIWCNKWIRLILNWVFKTEVIFKLDKIDWSFNNFWSVTLRVGISLLFKHVILFFLIELVMYVLFSLLVLKLICLSLCFNLRDNFIKRVIQGISLFQLMFQQCIFLKQRLSLWI